jgi:RNA polymerase sigma factor for flagellar operon FliA
MNDESNSSIITHRSAFSSEAQRPVEACQGMVKSLAWKIHRKLPPHVDLDDLVAYGQVGLAQAAKEFDAKRGGQFTTYAYYRIRGAIYDGLSQMSWFNRRDYHACKYEQMADPVLELDAEQAAPSRGVDEEVAWLSGMTSKLSIVYLASSPEAEAGASSLIDQSGPPGEAMFQEMRVKLAELIDALPADAGGLIRGTYFDGLTLTEAGRRLGISKAWASRLHAKTLERLGRALHLMGADA